MWAASLSRAYGGWKPAGSPADWSLAVRLRYYGTLACLWCALAFLAELPRLDLHSWTQHTRSGTWIPAAPGLWTGLAAIVVGSLVYALALPLYRRPRGGARVGALVGLAIVAAIATASTLTGTDWQQQARPGWQLALVVVTFVACATAYGEARTTQVTRPR